MFPLPYIIYQMAFRYNISPTTILELSTSNKHITINLPTRIGLLLPFAGPESHYLEYLLDTELMYYAIGTHTQLVAQQATQPKDLLTFLKRFTIDRVSWFKALFRLISGEPKSV
jgi:hypothetical protein